MSGCAPSARREREALAIRMLHLGFRGSIIAQEAELSGVTVRRLRKEILGGTTPASSGRLPETSGIVRVRRRLIEAGLFIIIYRSLNNMPLQQKPCIETIMHAYAVYREMHRTVHLGRRLDGQCLKATDAWVLARDLHTGWLALHRCPGCRAPYLSVPDQQLNRGCPFCSLSGGLVTNGGKVP